MTSLTIHSQIKAAYPQALAKLIVVLNDIHQAEEFLQSAVEQALLSWPKSQPENTVAWLVKVAKNKYIDYFRKQKKHCALEVLEQQFILPELSEEALLLSYNDDLLRLIFTCCHPSLNQQTQLVLALKHILGLSVTQIASALLVNKKTLEQRLVRAKKKISANNIQYEIPGQKRWPDRLKGVLKTIYLLFNEGYLTTCEETHIRHSLCKEAIRLSRLLHQCIKNDAEVIGLLALLLQQDARAPARIDEQGNMVLLPEQRRHLWKKPNILEANILVEKALRYGRGTFYATQAAIASLHNNASCEEDTDWLQIYGLYCHLILLDDNPVIKLNAAIALFKTGNRLTAIEIVKKLESELSGYRHYYTGLAGLYFESEEYAKALKNYQVGLVKTDSPSEQRFIKKRIDECMKK